jgi:hypothetical protein
MSREWYAVESRRFRDLRFRRLSDDARLTLFYLEGVAGDQEPEAIWSSTEDLAAILQMYGLRLEMARASITELVASDWIVTLSGERVALRDWDAVQVALSKKIKNEWEAARLRTWRKKKKGEDGWDEKPGPYDHLLDNANTTTPTSQDTTHRNTYVVRTDGLEGRP